jgi:hypothetical protein
VGALLAGCSRDGSDCFIGDRDAGPELAIVVRSLDGRALALAPGAEVPLTHAPQGGKVILAGVRARNVSCIVELTGSLRDEESGLLLAVEVRPVLLAPTADGFAEPDTPAELSNYANIPACPNPTARIPRNVFGEPWALKVRIEDRRGRSAETTVRVVPVCAEPGFQAQCECECDARYVLGTRCPAPEDGGA